MFTTILIGPPVGLGLPALPQLIPVTGTFAVPLTAYYTFLKARVIYYRQKESNSIGIPTDSKDSSEGSGLLAAFRAQANFYENVPLALILSGLVELNGGSRRALTGLLGTLVVARLFHAELGLMNIKNNYIGFGRPVGFFGTEGVILGLAGYAAYLVKGYWGF